MLFWPSQAQPLRVTSLSPRIFLSGDRIQFSPLVSTPLPRGITSTLHPCGALKQRSHLTLLLPFSLPRASSFL
ncbi:Uncharacterized protein TCM_006128 [Theobroma cacao]|uniref:Uncharacterized protein n=1 Tax=Theobroma cacao TaxID=3641 RepID=A0A061DY36_THECC|nr:Uncharacterized protein TCM_006128 [Theobroma cacao]